MTKLSTYKILGISALLTCAYPLYAADQTTTKDKTRSQDQTRTQDQIRDRDIYGNQLMTAEERNEFRNKMHAAKTAEERERIRAEHHERMKVRAKERGVTLPDAPPTDRGPGAGMRDGGQGSGAGAGAGAGAGGRMMGPGGPNR